GYVEQLHVCNDDPVFPAKSVCCNVHSFDVARRADNGWQLTQRLRVRRHSFPLCQQHRFRCGYIRGGSTRRHDRYEFGRRPTELLGRDKERNVFCRSQHSDWNVSRCLHQVAFPLWAFGPGAGDTTHYKLKITMKVINQVLLAVVLLGLAVGLYTYVFRQEGPVGASGAPLQQGCIVSTSSSVVIGNQFSEWLWPTTTRRAWAKIQQPLNASNTVSISFRHGAAATLSSPNQLTMATSTNPVPILLFGIETDIPYQGPVRALTNIGSTTVFVQQCVY